MRLILEGKKKRLLREMTAEMQQASARCSLRRRPRFATTWLRLQNLELRGDVDRDIQPEVFHTDPKKGLLGLKKVLGLPKMPRSIEGMDIAHLGGEDTVASLVAFLDGLPFKHGLSPLQDQERGRHRRLRLDA